VKKPKKSAAIPLGRPRIYPGARLNIAARLQPPVYQQLHAAAQLNGRSLSEEIEHRIVQSFEHDRAFPDPELRDLAVRLITRFVDAGGRAELTRGGAIRPVKEWINDPGIYTIAMAAAFDHLRVRWRSIDARKFSEWMKAMDDELSEVVERLLDTTRRNSPPTRTEDK
jgi:hypothetical protein